MSCSRISAIHLNQPCLTFFVVAPGSSCKIVTPDVDYASVLLFLSLLYDHCLQVRNSSQDSVRWRFFVPMEDVVLQLAFFVVFLGEEQHLSLSAGLLVDIFFGGVDQFEVIGIELESSGAECEV